MANIVIEDFGGMVPIRSNRLLPTNMALEAVNVDLESGEIRPVTMPASIHVFGGATKRAIRVPDPAFPSTPIWMAFNSRFARFFPSPTVNDLYDRHIWLDDNGVGVPQRLVQSSLAEMRVSDPPFLLGVPAPVDAPTVTPSGGTVPVETRAYVYTMVNQYGEEGQPSPAGTATGNANGTWDIAGMTVPAGIIAADRGLVTFRLYRTITGDQGTTDYFKVADIAIPTAIYSDTRPSDEVSFEGIILQSNSWREPEEMEGFIELPNGFFAGWNKRTVFFSEPFRPWAWPPEYILSVNYDIIAAGVATNSLILFTNSRPVVITGTRPENMQIIESDSPEPCYTPNSVVSSPEGVYYTGRTGLFLATQNSLTNLTRDLISNTDWAEHYQLADLSVTRINDTQIVAFSAQGFGFILDLSNQRVGLIRIENLAIVDSAWNDPYTGEVHVLSGNEVFRWQSPNTPNAVGKWASKEFHIAPALNFGVAALYLNSTAAADMLEPPIHSIINIPMPPVTGGPWLDQAAMYNYCLYNAVMCNEVPVEGTLPPGASPPADGWPFWFGIQPSDPDPDFDLDLPAGEFARLEVWANGILRFNEFVRESDLIRLPSGYKADKWRFVLVTRVGITRIVIAETGKELAKV